MLLIQVANLSTFVHEQFAGDALLVEVHKLIVVDRLDTTLDVGEFLFSHGDVFGE